MSIMRNELIKKLRSDICAKLDEIGTFVDNELADYIMVMVANQKSRYQMKDDLSLFLGKDTDDFVNWLHDMLKNIQLNATAGDEKKANASSKKNESNAKTSKEVKPPSKVNDKQKSENEKTTAKRETKEEPKKEEQSLSAVRDENSKPESEKEQNDEVVLHLNPDGGEVDELLQENINDERKADKKQTVVRTARPKAEPLKKYALNTPSSTIGAVLNHEDDDKYDPTKPTFGSVASIVKITQRKSSIPAELQANKMLLMRAVKDVHKSHETSVKGSKRSSDETEYTPTPIKKRLGDKQSPDMTEQSEKLHPNDLRNYISKKDINIISVEIPRENTDNRIVKDSKIEVQDNKNTQFVVTMDGVDHTKYEKNFNSEEILFGEDMDEEFIENDETPMDCDTSFNDDDDTSGPNKLNERCRFWPACKNGDKCEYFHPNTACKAFPRCKFGEKCLYIHPNCKFDAMCTRKDCPYTHASKRKIPTSPAIISSLLPPSSVKWCKYLPNCKNPACAYFHPKICHFGAKCRSITCPFVHPMTNYSSQSTLPHPNQLKWKAKDHISERPFAMTNTVESVQPSIQSTPNES